MNRKRVNVRDHEVADGLVHLSVPLQLTQASEALRHDQDREVPPTIGRAGMPGVVMAVIHHLESGRLERLEPTSQPFDPGAGHGSTWTKGFTS
jgi:hypothetical protein